jgi:hypothetical protein
MTFEECKYSKARTWEIENQLFVPFVRKFYKLIFERKGHRYRYAKKPLQLLQYTYGPCLHPSSPSFSIKSTDLHHLDIP